MWCVCYCGVSAIAVYSLLWCVWCWLEVCNYFVIIGLWLSFLLFIDALCFYAVILCIPTHASITQYHTQRTANRPPARATTPRQHPSPNRPPLTHTSHLEQSGRGLGYKAYAPHTPRPHPPARGTTHATQPPPIPRATAHVRTRHANRSRHPTATQPPPNRPRHPAHANRPLTPRATAHARPPPNHRPRLTLLPFRLKASFVSL